MIAKMAVHATTHSAVAAQATHEAQRESRRRAIRVGRRSMHGRTQALRPAHAFTPRAAHPSGSRGARVAHESRQARSGPYRGGAAGRSAFGRGGMAGFSHGGFAAFGGRGR
jgi:hypothetical protein